MIMEENKTEETKEEQGPSESQQAETKEESTPRQQARENFKSYMKQQALAMKLPIAKSDPTEEELDGMIQEQIKSLKESLEETELTVDVANKYMARVAANRDVLINVDLKEAENEWHKKAIQAEIDEMQAIMAEKKYNLKGDLERIRQLNESLKKMQDML
jgi:hypothetical protein